MSRTVHAARVRAAFLRALGDCGNVQLAAEKAGSDKGVFYNRRRRDPGFAARWDAALARAGAGLAPGAAGGERRAVWSSAAGVPRVVRIMSERRWTPTAEGVFLAHLAATANVRGACAVVGFSTTAVYQRRMRWPGFREAWEEALAQGYARIEMMLIEEAGRPVVLPCPEGETAAPVDKELALNLLRLHRAAVKGGPAQRYDWRAKPDDPDAMRASILRKIEVIERAERRAKKT